jgi:subtilisin family serine protease
VRRCVTHDTRGESCDASQHLSPNLSLFADPYLYYCANDAGQRAILQDLQSAARYAQQRGVVIVAAAGNEGDDLGHPTTDPISPDWPPDTAVVREVGNNCRVAPAEIPGVVTVSASGVNTLGSYSNVGTPVHVTAPGGDVPARSPRCSAPRQPRFPVRPLGRPTTRASAREAPVTRRSSGPGW